MPWDSATGHEKSAHPEAGWADAGRPGSPGRSGRRGALAVAGGRAAAGTAPAAAALTLPRHRAPAVVRCSVGLGRAPGGLDRPAGPRPGPLPLALARPGPCLA